MNYFLAVILRLIEAFFFAWFLRFFIFCVRPLRPLPMENSFRFLKVTSDRVEGQDSTPPLRQFHDAGSSADRDPTSNPTHEFW